MSGVSSKNDIRSSVDERLDQGPSETEIDVIELAEMPSDKDREEWLAPLRQRAKTSATAFSRLRTLRDYLLSRGISIKAIDRFEG